MRSGSLLLGCSLVLLACAAPLHRSVSAPVGNASSSPPVPPGRTADARLGRPGERAERLGDEIVVCGQGFHTGTRVVLWTDPGGYDAYRPHRHFAPEQVLPEESQDVARYGTLRRGLPPAIKERVRRDGWRLVDLQAVVHQVVIHYDQAGTSARCFEVLQDVRGLSAHFLLDVDGTVYQTLDLKERAWHAAETNDRSVGIEIANIGAYADRETLDRWYVTDAEGSRLRIPETVRRGALPQDLVARPVRAGPVEGVVHGKRLLQQDYTAAQYDALVHLLATLSVVLPRCRLEVPRGAEGRVLDTLLLAGGTREAFEGLTGHWHVSAEKVDPGPAFQWDLVLARARALAGGDRPDGPP